MYMCILKLKPLSCTVGHGRSEGDRVHVETFDTYTDDVIEHVERKMAEYPDIPCLLMGHSMVSACHQLCTRTYVHPGLCICK